MFKLAAHFLVLVLFQRFYYLVELVHMFYWGGDTRIIILFYLPLAVWVSRSDTLHFPDVLVLDRREQAV